MKLILNFFQIRTLKTDINNKIKIDNVPRYNGAQLTII